MGDNERHRLYLVYERFAKRKYESIERLVVTPNPVRSHLIIIFQILFISFVCVCV